MNMNLLRVVCLLTMFSLCLAQGSGKKNNFSGFDKGYLKVSYNYFPTFISEIGTEIKDFGVDEFDDRIFLYGGELCGNINPSFGVGIQYFTGSDMSDKIVSFGDTLKLDRSVSYGMSFVSLVINYRKSLTGPVEFFGTLSGGYGSVKVVISQDYGDQAFGDLWNSFDPDSYLYDYNRSVTFNPDLFIFRAENGLRFYAGTRLSVDITVGYTYGFVSDTGEINYGFETLKNVPDLDFKGMNYGLGISFGY